MFQRYKKIPILLLIAILALSPVSRSLQPNKAAAIAGVGDLTFVDLFVISDPITLGFYTEMGAASAEIAVATAATAVSTADTAVNTTSETVFSWGKFALEIGGQLLKKLIIDRLVDALISWINNGGKGAVIEDWDAFFRDAGQLAVGEVAKELGAGFLCSPFNLNLQIALNPIPKFSQRLTCSLDQITGNINNFIENFENGGWIAYQEQWYPQNNFYGGVIIALNEADERAAAALAASKAEGAAGQGFKPFKQCDANGTNCVTLTPGQMAAWVTKSAYIDIPANSILNANDIADYIGAIVDATINRLIKAGIDGIKGSNKKSSAYTVATPSDPCAGLTGEAYRACKNLKNVSLSSQSVERNNMIAQINKTLSPRQDATSILNQLIDKQQSLVDALTSLSSCQSNNNTDTQSSLQNEGATLNDLKDKYDTNQTFIQPLKEAIDNINFASDFTAMTIEFNNVQQLLDPTTANNFLNSIKAEQTAISENVNAKLPSIQSQLTGCPVTF